MDPTVPPLPPGFQLDSSPSASATPPPPPGFELDSAPHTGTVPVASSTPSVGGVVRQGITGVNEGINKGLSIFDPVAKLGNAAGNVVRGVIGKEPVTLPTPSEAFAHQFVEPGGQPDNGLERAVRMGGDLAGQTLPLAAGIGGIANSGARAVVGAEPTIVNALKGAYNQILDFAAANPARAAITGETGAFQSGAGGQTARDVAKDSGVGPQGQNLAEAAGQMFTPMAVAKYMQFSPTALAVKGATKIAQKAIGFVPTNSAERSAEDLAYANREGKYADPNVPAPNPPATGVLGPIKNAVQAAQDAGAAERTAKAQGTVGKEFNQVLQRPEAAANLDESNQLEKDIPGFNPGVAKASGDPALLNLQQDIGAKSVGPDLRNAQSQTDNSARSIRDYLESIVPPVQKSAPPDFVGPMPATDTPQDIVAKSVAGRVGEDTAAIGQQAADAKNKIQGLSDSLPQTDRIAQGTALRDARSAAQKEMDAKTSALRANIGDADKPITVTPAVEPEVSTPYGSAGSESPVKMTLNQILDRRTAINQQMRDFTNSTSRTVSDVATMRSLQSERDNLDALVTKAAEGNAGLRAYAEQYKNENVPQFRQGASAEVGQRDSFGYGGNKVDPEKVAGKFFNPNEESAAKQFDVAMGHDPGARQQMVDHALDDIRQKGTDATTGLIKEGFIDKWLLRNKRVLDQMPQTGPEIRAAVTSKDPDALYARIGDLEQRQRAVADTKVAGLLGKNPETQIDAALNDWQVMRGLKRSVAGDPQAEQALTRAVWERATAAGGTDTLLDPAKLQSWIDGHKRALGEVLTPEHMGALQKVIKAATIEGRLPRPKGAVDQPGTLADKAAGATGLSMQGYLSRALNVAKGYMSKEYAAADIAARVWHNMAGKEVDAAWREALSNPKVAQNLANMTSGKPTAPQMKRLKTYLLTAGVADTSNQAETGDLPHK